MNTDILGFLLINVLWGLDKSVRLRFKVEDLDFTTLKKTHFT